MPGLHACLYRSFGGIYIDPSRQVERERAKRVKISAVLLDKQKAIKRLPSYFIQRERLGRGTCWIPPCTQEFLAQPRFSMSSYHRSDTSTSSSVAAFKKLEGQDATIPEGSTTIDVKDISARHLLGTQRLQAAAKP